MAKIIPITPALPEQIFVSYEKIRSISGCEDFSDEVCSQLANTLLSLARLLVRNFISNPSQKEIAPAIARLQQNIAA